jgi:predicted AAA+ superfamily ATPase
MSTTLPRFLEKEIKNNLKENKVIGIFGARRAGKSVLLEKIAGDIKEPKLIVNGENLDVAEILTQNRLSILKNFLAGYKYLFIDEAHKIPNIGTSLKLIVDNIKGMRILITGSAPLDLKQKIGEPLTGRSFYYHLYPFSEMELKEDYMSARAGLINKLIYGSYPEVYLEKKISEKKKLLESIKNGYLLKDILEIDNQKDSLFVLNLLRLVAFQIGKDISYNELARQLGVNSKTVIRYLNILEKIYILFSLRGYSRNLRKEYSKTPRYYFRDNGIRNVLINNFNSPESRNDIGMLWENYVISERLKRNDYKLVYANCYFWRTYDRKEIDLIEEKGGKLYAFEIKWKQDKVKKPEEFLKTYRNSKFILINKDNYLNFITK